MTRILKLVKGATELDLLNDNGIHLRAGGDNWQPVYPFVTGYGDPDPVVETMRLQCRGTSQNAIAGTMQIWADMMRGASIYRTDANGTAPVWLHAKLDDETGERRSIVHRIDAAWVDSGMTEVIDQDVLLFDAAIERGPYWEATTPTAMGTASIYTNLVANPSFDTAGAGGADVFASWDETAGDGTITDIGGNAQLTAGATINTKIAQTITVERQTYYALQLYGSILPADSEGRIGVYDVSNSADIIPITGSGITEAGGEFSKASFAFFTPDGCTSIRIDLWCPAIDGDVCYYHEVGLYALNYGPARIIDYTAANGDIVGDVPARVRNLALRQETTTEPLLHPIDTQKVWVGIRSEEQHPGLASFVPVWELEDGTAGISTAGATDINASGYSTGGTSIMRVTPGTATWASRVTMANPGGTANYGEHLWLLRTKVSTGEYEVKLRWSISDSQYIEGPTVSVSNTGYMWKELGQSALPLWDRRIITSEIVSRPASLDSSWYVDVMARRTSGTGVMDLDCIGIVPLDEGFLVIEDINRPIGWSAAGTSQPTFVVAATSPMDARGAATISSTPAVGEQPTISGRAFGLPPGDGRLILFVNGTATSDLVPLFELYGQSSAAGTVANSSYYPRWLSLRGAE